MGPVPWSPRGPLSSISSPCSLPLSWRVSARRQMPVSPLWCRGKPEIREDAGTLSWAGGFVPWKRDREEISCWSNQDCSTSVLSCLIDGLFFKHLLSGFKLQIIFKGHVWSESSHAGLHCRLGLFKCFSFPLSSGSSATDLCKTHSPAFVPRGRDWPAWAGPQVKGTVSGRPNHLMGTAFPPH